MGAVESTPENGSDLAQFESDDMYVVLGVEEEASGADIKMAYRKLALAHHPDKNVSDSERATQRFAAIQQAYETLSDSQRRAVYDSEKILRERAHASRQAPEPEAEEDVTATMPGYMHTDAGSYNTSAWTHFQRTGGATRTQSDPWQRWADGNTYKDLTANDILMLRFCLQPGMSFFDDGPTSLYTICRRIFARIAMDEPDVSGAKLPGFGTLDTPWSRPGGRRRFVYAGGGSVAEFYNAWTTFETSKEFVVGDDESASGGSSRAAKRRAHAQRKKARAHARREYNDAVRTFVTLVRSIDPRYVCRNAPCMCPGCFARYLGASL